MYPWWGQDPGGPILWIIHMKNSDSLHSVRYFPYSLSEGDVSTMHKISLKPRKRRWNESPKPRWLDAMLIGQKLRKKNCNLVLPCKKRKHASKALLYEYEENKKARKVMSIGQIGSSISKVYLGSMCLVHSCIHWLRPHIPQPSALSRAIGLIHEGAIDQQR